MSSAAIDRPAPKTRVKICGVTRPDDALLAIDLGASLLGINFYEPSPRSMRPRQAADLVDAVRALRPAAEVLWVGVFVDAGLPTLRRVADVAALDLVQLHGDEDPEEMAPIADRAIRVFRVRERVSREALEEDIEPWRELGTWGYLLDTHNDDLYGGTGESWEVSSLGRIGDDAPRLLLAGGLDPDNVAEAIEACDPWGVDVCSGIESEPGLKDPRLTRRLFEEIRSHEATHHETRHPED